MLDGGASLPVSSVTSLISRFESMTLEPLITSRLIKNLRDQSAKAEADGKLTDEQLAVIYGEKWFKLFVPEHLGGLALTFPQGVRLEEALAYIDGSLGWTVTLCSGANWFVGYIDVHIASSIFAADKVCLGGSGQSSGTARINDGGYIVSGTWRYATGARHNTFFTGNCVVEQDGKPILDEDGNPLIRSFLFAKQDVQVIEDWNTVGLRATASHSFRVTDLWVDKAHTFLIAPKHAKLELPIYQYPFLQFAEATLAANTLGMARHFVTCAGAIIATKHRLAPESPPHRLLEIATTQLQHAKRQFYETLDCSWNELLTGNGVAAETLLAVSEQSRALVQVSRQQVMSLYPHCGLLAADASSEINRIWRDLFTASQHALLR